MADVTVTPDRLESFRQTIAATEARGLERGLSAEEFARLEDLKAGLSGATTQAPAAAPAQAPRIEVPPAYQKDVAPDVYERLTGGTNRELRPDEILLGGLATRGQQLRQNQGIGLSRPLNR